MNLTQSLLQGIRCSGDYFLSTFIFGIMFGISAHAAGLEQWLALLMSGAVFSASAQFAALEFWSSPLPYGTIALSVLLVSTRNILLGMAMAHHFDGHSVGRRTLWLFLLNDPGVVTSYTQPQQVDRLGYVTGYGISMMISWLSSVLIGLNIAWLFADIDMKSASFAGPLVMGTMMVLFAKGSDSPSLPWIVSGVAALVLDELGATPFVILLLSVAVGVSFVPLSERSRNA